jgi:hypothetical protein
LPFGKCNLYSSIHADTSWASTVARTNMGIGKPETFTRFYLVVANWIAEKGLPEKANWVREEFLTGTAIAVIVALLILLVKPKSSSRAVSFLRRCPVCDKRLIGNANYCGECGSNVES